MNISLLDRSHYFKGLLLLIRKDQQITPPEIALMKHIGKVLGFEEVFCERTIHEVLENKHIEDLPPHFESKEIAEKFILDGVTISFCDHEIHPSEEAWLNLTADKNNIDRAWVLSKIEAMKNQKELIPLSDVRLEVEDLTVYPS